MRYLYIIILMIVLAGMFVYGDRIPASPEMTYTERPVEEKRLEETFCSNEVEKYKKELDQAKTQIESLNSLLEQTRSRNSSYTTYSAN